MSLIIYLLVCAVVLIMASFPGWVCLINAWLSRNSSKIHNRYYLYSVWLLVLCVVIISWLYWVLIFSSPQEWEDSNGLVTFIGLLVTPFLSLVVTVPIGFLIERSAKKRDLWQVSKYK